jgi:hypothetical protein
LGRVAALLKPTEAAHADIDLYSLLPQEESETMHAVVLSLADPAEQALPSGAVGINQTGLKTSASVTLNRRFVPANAVIETAYSTAGVAGTLAPVEALPRKKARGLVCGARDIGISISSLPGHFYRSKLVTLTPKAIVVNKTGFPLEIVQVRGDLPAVLRSPSSR